MRGAIGGAPVCRSRRLRAQDSLRCRTSEGCRMVPSGPCLSIVCSYALVSPTSCSDCCKRRLQVGIGTGMDIQRRRARKSSFGGQNCLMRLCEQESVRALAPFSFRVGTCAEVLKHSCSAFQRTSSEGVGGRWGLHKQTRHGRIMRP